MDHITGPPAAGAPRWDFEQAPLVVIWEITRACALACKHCRADAITRRDPLELSFEEGCRLIDQVKELGSPVFVLTGGDPLLRSDFFDLVSYATSIGVRVASSPSGTKLVTPQAMQQAAAAGLRRVQFSLDGARPESHDGFRGVKGSFQWTLDGIAYAREAGMEIQIGTTISRHTLNELEQVSELVREIGCSMWSLFFLVPVGRGRAPDMISPEEAEDVLLWLRDFSRTVPFAIKTTEAPFFRRVLLQDPARGEAKHFSGSPASPPFISAGVNDGKGFMFIDYQGEAYPSGFLPVSAGNVREHSLSWLYRESDLFRQLRDPSLLKGKCGACEYKRYCGGSRARAYATTGDYLESDPCCIYVPNLK